MPNGHYVTWIAADTNEHRINDLHANDQPVPPITVEARLADRRLELETMLSQIAALCNSSEYDDVMMYSTGLPWVWKHLEQVYDIEKKGVHFMKLGQIVFDKTNDESHTAFYKRLRSHFQDNLRQQGDIVRWKENFQLLEHEKLSPTMECTIVYWSLKEIDARLPEQVELVYGHLMKDSTTIMDLQPTIFQAIPRLLNEIDVKDAGMNAVYGDVYGEGDDEIDLAAFGAYGGRGNRRGFPTRGRGQQQRGAGRGGYGRGGREKVSAPNG